MVSGASFYALLIGTMSTFLAAIDTKGHELAEKQLVINEFCKQAGIGFEIKERMRAALEYRANNNFFSVFDKNSTLDGMSLRLRYKVNLLNSNPTLSLPHASKASSLEASTSLRLLSQVFLSISSSIYNHFISTVEKLFIVVAIMPMKVLIISIMFR